LQLLAINESTLLNFLSVEDNFNVLILTLEIQPHTKYDMNYTVC
jgi:hypothetical protein